MGESHGHARDAYSGTIGICIGCTSALPRGTLFTCRSENPIIGNGHIRLYPFDIVPTPTTVLEYLYFHLGVPVN